MVTFILRDQVGRSFTADFVDQVEYIFGACIYLGWCETIVYLGLAIFMLMWPLEPDETDDEPYVLNNYRISSIIISLEYSTIHITVK